MNALLINGSARKNGNTAAALSLLDAFFQQKGLEVRWFQMENRPLRGCIGCNGCVGTNRCAFRDDPCNQLIDDLLWADGVVIGSPVYFAAPSGGLYALLDRAFYATCTRDQLLKGKPAAALVSWHGRVKQRQLTTCTATLFPVKCRSSQVMITPYSRETA